MTYASFKIRLLASLLDGAIYFLFISLLVFFVLNQATIASAITALLFLLIVVFNPIVAFSSAFFMHYFGGSPGKLLTGLRVLTADGKKLSFKRILFRQTIGYSFSWIFFGMGYYSIIKDPKKQGWHDKTVNSVVTMKGNMFIIGLMMLIMIYIAAIYILINSMKSFSEGPIVTEIQVMVREEAMKQKTRNSSSSDSEYNFNYESNSEFNYEYNYPVDLDTY